MELSFTARNVLIGATMLGSLGGMLGSFALLRRQSLLGDALAHAALPGVCLGYLLTGSKTQVTEYLQQQTTPKVRWSVFVVNGPHGPWAAMQPLPKPFLAKSDKKEEAAKEA